MAKRCFNDKWLEKQDPNNQLVSLWCSKKNDYTAACSFCKADISVDHIGFGSLKQNANGSKTTGRCVKHFTGGKTQAPNKKIVTKSNTSLKPETLRGLRAIKCAINEYGGVTKVPITLDMVSAAERSHSIYKQHMREEESKKKKKEKEKEEIEERKRKLTEMKDEVEKMREKLDELKEREKKISVDIDNAMDCIKEARNLIKEGRMRDNMVSVESGEKGLDLGIEKETAGREKLKEVSTERQKIEKILLELKQFKKKRISAK